MVMRDEASKVRRVIYLQRERERAVYAGDRGEHSEKGEKSETKRSKRSICTNMRNLVVQCSSGQTQRGTF